jgi:hypothetical protein
MKKLKNQINRLIAGVPDKNNTLLNFLITGRIILDLLKKHKIKINFIKSLFV